MLGREGRGVWVVRFLFFWIGFVEFLFKGFLFGVIGFVFGCFRECSGYEGRKEVLLFLIKW